MKYKLIIIAIICISVPKLNAVTLDSLLIRSDSICKQLFEINNSKNYLRIITDEACYQSHLKVAIINELKDSLLLNKSDMLNNELGILINCEKVLLELSLTKDTVLDAISSKRVVFMADSILITLEKIDGAIKCKTDSIYANAVFIKNYSTKREIVLMPAKYRLILILFCWFITIFSALILFSTILKSKYKSIGFYSCLLTIILFSMALFKPVYLYTWLGKKVVIPAWEYNTLEGHKWYDLFMKQSNEKNETQKITESAMHAFKNYYRAAYTSVNIEHERLIYGNIKSISAILYPPCPRPDSIAVVKLRKPDKLMEGGENSSRITSSAKRMKLDLLLKVKSVL